jgi:hypothetical protein
MYFANNGWPVEFVDAVHGLHTLVPSILHGTRSLSIEGVDNHNVRPQPVKVAAKIVTKKEISFIHGLEEFPLPLLVKVSRIAIHLIDAILHNFINLEPFVE